MYASFTHKTIINSNNQSSSKNSQPSSYPKLRTQTTPNISECRNSIQADNGNKNCQSGVLYGKQPYLIPKYGYIEKHDHSHKNIASERIARNQAKLNLLSQKNEYYNKGSIEKNKHKVHEKNQRHHGKFIRDILGIQSQIHGKKSKGRSSGSEKKLKKSKKKSKKKLNLPKSFKVLLNTPIKIRQTSQRTVEKRRKVSTFDKNNNNKKIKIIHSTILKTEKSKHQKNKNSVSPTGKSSVIKNKSQIKNKLKNNKQSHKEAQKSVIINPINVQQMCEEISSEISAVVGHNYSVEMYRERYKSIGMLGKIANSMGIKKQIYSLAVSYLDKFLDPNTDPKTVKIIAITSLIVALKVQHAQSVGTLVYQFIQQGNIDLQQKGNRGTPRQIQRNQFNLGFADRSLEHQHPDNPESLMTSTQFPKFHLNRPKVPNIFTVVLSHEQLFSEYDRILCKQDISDMQMQMIVKFNFRLIIKSMHSWMCSICKIWNSFLTKKSFQSKSKRQKLKLKKLTVQTNQQLYLELLCLSQLCQFSKNSNKFSKPTICLSLLYLLMRISYQFVHDREKGYQYYKLKLNKSANILFIDKNNINEIFGQFLIILELDMGYLVSCCEFVSRFFYYKVIKPVIQEEIKYVSSQTWINYRYYSQLYRFLMVKHQE